MRKTAILAVLASGLAGSAQAQWGASHVYVGAGAGPSKFSFDSGSLPITNSTASSLSVDDDSSTAAKIYGGWRFNPFFAAEVGIVDFGTFTATRQATAPALGTARSEISVAGVYVDAVGIAPIAGAFELFGKVGAIATGVSAKRTTTGGVLIDGSNSSDDSTGGTKLHAAVGMNFRITSRVWARLEYERAFKVGDKALGEGDVSAFSIGASYRF
jgi:OmpA-OmpF porin, OOP family